MMAGSRNRWVVVAFVLAVSAGLARDEGPAAVLGPDEPLGLEPRVHGAHGVGVHARRRGHLAHAGQAGAGTELAGGHRGAQVPGELDAERDLAVAVEPDARRLQVFHTPRVPVIAHTV